MIAFVLIFWMCLVAVLHSYVIFPIVLNLLASGKKNNELVYSKPEEWPSVAVIFAAYNEEKVLRQKLESLLATDYPIEKLEILIGSDNSTDATNAILEEYHNRYPIIKYLIGETRVGKPGILNQLVQHTTAEIIFFTDANVFFTPQTILQNIKHYKNSDIGLVGSVIVNPESSNGIAPIEKKYIDRENFIKYNEGLVFGCTIAPFGAAFSMRKNLYSFIPKDLLVDDMYISMKVLQQGYKSIVEMNSIAYEEVPEELEREFGRKRRISAGNFQNLNIFKGLLWPPFNGLAFCFLSHKVLRWLSPMFMAGALLSSALLAMNSNFYGLALLIQLILILLVYIAYLSGLDRHIKLIKFVTYFYSMNIALLLGFIDYLKGINSSIWEPTRRA